MESEITSVQDRETGSLHIHVLVTRRTRDSFIVNNIMQLILSYLMSQKGFGKVVCTVCAQPDAGTGNPFKCFRRHQVDQLKSLELGAMDIFDGREMGQARR